MFKKLSFMTALLLLSGIACGANPSATLSVQIVPAVSQSNNAPAPAAAAGFTNLIIDYDFTQSNPWADRNSWLRCHDGSGASNPLLYQDWIGFGGWQFPPCSNISQGTDPFGSLALHLHMDKAILDAMGCEPTNCNNNVAPLSIVQTVDSAGNGNVLPSNVYVEVIGLTRPSDPSMFRLDSDFWSYDNGGGTEWDGIEWYGFNHGFSTYHNNSSGNVQQTNGDVSLDQSAYHNYAWRVTSNGTSDGFFCTYLDNTPSSSSPGNCISWFPTNNQAANPSPATVQILMGFVACSDGVGPACPNSSIDVWVQRLRVWSCGGINSGAKCFSSSANP